MEVNKIMNLLDETKPIIAQYVEKCIEQNKKQKLIELEDEMIDVITNTHQSRSIKLKLIELKHRVLKMQSFSCKDCRYFKDCRDAKLLASINDITNNKGGDKM